jgi:hypothetical protein
MVVAGLWVSTDTGSTAMAVRIRVSTGEGMGGGGARRGDEAHGGDEAEAILGVAGARGISPM